MTSRLPEVLSEITALEAQLSKLKQEASELSRTASLLTKLDTTLPMKLSEYVRSAFALSHSRFQTTASDRCMVNSFSQRRYGRQMILPGVGLPGENSFACLNRCATLTSTSMAFGTQAS